MAMSNMINDQSRYDYMTEMMIRKQMEEQKRNYMRNMQMMMRNPYELQEVRTLQPQQPESKAQDKRLLLLEV